MARSALCCVFVVVGLFCVNAWPSRLAKKQDSAAQRQCFQQQVQGCALPVLMQYAGMSLEQIKAKLASTPLSQTCAPVQEAVTCARSAVQRVCGLDINSIPAGDGMPKPRAILNAINYVCATEVAAIDRNKQCLIYGEWSSLLTSECGDRESGDMLIPGLAPATCPSYGDILCVAGVVRSECNDELASRAETLLHQVVRDLGCP